MRKTSILVITILLAVAVGALAADVTGKWVAQVPGRSGQTRETTFNFKVDGTKLTGTMTGRQGDVEIAGTVSGDTVTFSVETQRGKQTYTGKISGNEIQFKRDTGQGAAQEFTAKRAN
jgi:hypothetical protein